MADFGRISIPLDQTPYLKVGYKILQIVPGITK